MLALTRKPGQKIMIGDDIVIHFVDVQGDSIRVAIEAPKQIKIYREELYTAIIAENKSAMNSSNEKIELPQIHKK